MMGFYFFFFFFSILTVLIQKNEKLQTTLESKRKMALQFQKCFPYISGSLSPICLVAYIVYHHRRQWVREEDLAKDLKLHSKQLRRTLRFFEEEKLVTRDHRREVSGLTDYVNGMGSMNVSHFTMRSGTLQWGQPIENLNC